MRWQAITLIALAALFAGCAPKAPEATSRETPPSASNKAAPDGASTNAPSEPGPDLATLPSGFKNDAFDYYGLGYEEPRDLELVSSDQPETVLQGTQTVKLQSVQEDQAVFVIERTGGLAAMGREEVAIRDGGLYTISSSMGKVSSPSLQLPKDLSIGSNWEARERIDSTQRGPIELTGMFKAARNEKVKTKAGEHDALLVTLDGNMTIEGRKSAVKSKIWYVRGRGAVKIEMQTTEAGKKPVTMVIQETK